MHTGGVDLAAEAKGTAVAVVEWAGSGADAGAGVGARLVELRVGVDDAVIVGVAGGVEKLGIDCALGWPDAFVEFVTAHAAGRAVAGEVDGGMEWRRRLAYRETDRYAREVTGRWPLSVSTDRLGLTAMRCAGLLARLGESGVEVDRAGSGLVVEVYPGASLRLWRIDTRNYRVDAEARRRVLTDLRHAAPWLELSGYEELMIASGDAFDAVVAALAARSAAVGVSTQPTPELTEQARREGWIALPTGPLRELAQRPRAARANREAAG